MPVVVSPGVYDSLGAIMIITTFFSLMFNGCGLTVFLRNKALRSPTNFFIIALCICDLLMCLPASLTSANCFYHQFIFDHSVCIFEGFMVYFLGLTSLYLLAAISLDRYVIIAKPLHSAKVTKRVATLSVVVCWILGFVWSSLPLMGWNRYTQEGLGVSCSVVWQSKEPGNISYIITIFIFCFILPVGLMVFCYYHVYMTVRHITQNNMWDQNSRVGQKNMRLEKKMFHTCIVMVSVFLLSWTPYAVVSFISAFGPRDIVPPLVATIPAMIAKLSGLWNPVIYIGTNKQFRVAFYKMIPFTRLREWFSNLEEGSIERAVSQSETLRYSKTNASNSNLQYSATTSGVSVLPSPIALNVNRPRSTDHCNTADVLATIPETILRQSTTEKVTNQAETVEARDSQAAKRITKIDKHQDSQKDIPGVISYENRPSMRDHKSDQMAGLEVLSQS